MGVCLRSGINKMKRYIVIVIALLIFNTGCTEKQTIKGRWYSQAQVDSGATIFKTHCASCHGDSAQGLVKDWKKPLANGSHPPPPLNGSAHTWHHPKKALKRTIRNGGVRLGGTMPPFNDALNNNEIDSVLAYIQNIWSDRIYSAWIKRGGLK